MFGTENLGSNAQAAVVVGTVLVEAFLLYVGYGVIATYVGPSFKRVLEGRCAVAEMLFRRCSGSENGGANQ